MTRINERIRAPKVRVILSTTNEQLGVMPTHAALTKAREVGLDLVEVAARADPPVCKIVNYGKYKYEQSKLKKESGKKQGGKLKEVKFRVRIDPHDYEIKMARAEDFLDGGNKLKVQLQFRGREMAHPELGFVLMEKVKNDLSTMANIDMEARRAGRSINMTLSPLASHMRKRKFRRREEADEDFENEDDEDQDFEDDDHEDDEAAEEHAEQSADQV